MNQILDQAFGFGFGMGWECVLEISDVFGKDGFLCEDGDTDYHLWHGKYELNRDELPCSVPRWGVEPQARPPCWLKPSWGQFAWIAPVFVHLQVDFLSWTGGSSFVFLECRLLMSVSSVFRLKREHPMNTVAQYRSGKAWPAVTDQNRPSQISSFDKIVLVPF